MAWEPRTDTAVPTPKKVNADPKVQVRSEITKQLHELAFNMNTARELGIKCEFSIKQEGDRFVVKTEFWEKVQ